MSLIKERIKNYAISIYITAFMYVLIINLMRNLNSTSAAIGLKNLYFINAFVYFWLMISQFSSVVSNSLWPHGLQHTRPLCPSPTPRVNSHPLSQWCHPTSSSSVVPFSSRLQSFPASGSFQMSQFFPSGGQSIGVSTSASVLPMNIQDWFPLGLTALISLQSKGLSSLLQHHSSKASILQHSAFFIAQLSQSKN